MVPSVDYDSSEGVPKAQAGGVADVDNDGDLEMSRPINPKVYEVGEYHVDSLYYIQIIMIICSLPLQGVSIFVAKFPAC